MLPMLARLKHVCASNATLLLAFERTPLAGQSGGLVVNVMVADNRSSVS